MLIQICEARHDCMAIIDPPTGLSPSEVVDWHNGTGTFNDHAAYNSSYAATYYPWVKIYDAVAREYIFTPPSGHVLAVYAYTDYNAETWFAPAGLRRGRVISGVDVAHSCSPGEMDLLYGDGNAVNPIADFRQQGIVVWGQRTLQRSPTALDRVNVRRLLLYLRKVITTAAGYLVFEPNDPITWKSFGHLVIPYLDDVRQRRALYDFRVKCDETTNTPTVIDRNEMRAQILLKPVKAAEFIQIDFVITSTGANFDEVLY
jgi:phage tail sheath protein FI